MKVLTCSIFANQGPVHQQSWFPSMAAFGNSILLISRTRFTFAFPKSPVTPFLSNSLHIKALSTTWNALICRKSQFSFRVTFWVIKDTSNQRPQSIKVNSTIEMVQWCLSLVLSVQLSQNETEEIYSQDWSKIK